MHNVIRTKNMSKPVEQRIVLVATGCAIGSFVGIALFLTFVAAEIVLQGGHSDLVAEAVAFSAVWMSSLIFVAVCLLGGPLMLVSTVVRTRRGFHLLRWGLPVVLTVVIAAALGNVPPLNWFVAASWLCGVVIGRSLGEFVVLRMI